MPKIVNRMCAGNGSAYADRKLQAVGSPRVSEETLRFCLCNVFRIGDRDLEKRFENFA